MKLINRMRMLVLVVLMVLGSSVRADVYGTFQTTKYYSLNKRYFVQVTPKKRATLYHHTGQRTQRLWTCDLPELPGKLLVTNDGSRVVSVDCYYGNGGNPNMPVVLIFDGMGNELARYHLKDVASLLRLTQTTSTAYWYESAKFTANDRFLIVNTIVAKHDRAECRDARSLEEAERMGEICLATKPYERLQFNTATGKLTSRINIAAK